MNESTKYTNNSEGKRGVAILIVIAMLSTLMMAASAFSISMRLERKGAANYRHSVAARHLLWGSLSMAMTDIDDSIDPGSTSDFTVYPDWNVLWSDTDVNPPIYARTTSADSPFYIPGSLRNEIFNVKPEWIQIKDSTGVHIGRCSYLIANVSGLLDANMVGGEERAAGVSAAEIQLEGGLTAAEDRNAKHIRYETLRELSRLNPALYADLGGDNNGFATTFTHSIEGSKMVGGNPNNLEAKVNIGGSLSDIESKQTEFLAALENCGINQASDRALVYLSLLDYIDEDVWPRSMNIPNVEPVPMVNELKLRCRLSGSELRLRVESEFCYPYLNENQNQFAFEGELTFNYIADGAASVPIAHLTPLSSNPDEIVTVGTKCTASSGAYHSPQVTVSDWRYTFPSPLTNTLQITDATMKLTIKSTSGVDVDSVSVKLHDVPIDIAVAGDDITKVWEAKDPRYNHLEDCWRLENSGNTTWAAINRWPERRTQQAKDGTQDRDDSFMWYCSNTGYLRNVGEMGNLPCIMDADPYLKTLNLYPHLTPTTHHRIFDEFATSTNELRRGLVNINTTNTNVWEALFRDAALGDPDSTSVDRFDDSSEILSAAVAAVSCVKSISPIEDVSEFVEAFQWKTAMPNLTDFEREMLIGSTLSMMTARQNTFVVLLSAEKYVEFAFGASGGKSMAANYAVAVVSRDPFRDPSNGKHKMFVRSFKLLPQ